MQEIDEVAMNGLIQLTNLHLNENRIKCRYKSIYSTVASKVVFCVGNRRWCYEWTDTADQS